MCGHSFRGRIEKGAEIIKITRIFKKKKACQEIDSNKIIGVCLGWDLKPHLCFEDRTYLPTKAERILYLEYFIEGQEWPINPETKEKLPVAKVW